MRISTSGLHNNAVNSMLSQQAVLSGTQSQISSGKRVQSPKDDPIAAVHLLELQRALNEAEQYGANSNVATNRLTLEEQALADVNNVLHRVRELAVQANSSTVDDAGRRLISEELRGRLQELVGLANQRDANGEFLFSGFATQTQPFALSGSAVSYFGDQGNRMLQVSSTQRVADSHSGYEVFMAIPEGNGTFVTGIGGTNTGSGAVASGSVANASQWIPDDYTITFTSADAWQVTDSNGAVVTTGTYTNNGETQALSFGGVQVNFSGAPATGDTFTVSRSRTEDIFSTLNALIGTLETQVSAGPTRAAFTTNMANALAQLQQTSDHVLAIRSQVGVRLSSLESAEASREDQKVELQRMQGELRDLDYAEAISRMNREMVGLQAAQMSYSRISQLSLFNYL